VDEAKQVGEHDDPAGRSLSASPYIRHIQRPVLSESFLALLFPCFPILGSVEIGDALCSGDAAAFAIL